MTTGTTTPRQTDPSPLNQDEVLLRVLDFAGRFGEPHMRLAMYAALPLGLSDELLHLIRVNFVREAPWIAEADLLLSPLCHEVGSSLYEMDRPVRELLLHELRTDPRLGMTRVARLAEFLAVYTECALKVTWDPEHRDFLEAQRWASQAHLDPEAAAESLAAALGEAAGAASGPVAVPALPPARRSQVLRVAHIAQALSGPLLTQPKVLLYAAAADELIAGGAANAADLFRTLGPLDQAVRVGNVFLPAPHQFMTGPGTPTPPDSIEVFYSYAHEDEELVKELRKHLSILKRQGVIRDWYDREITAGTDWKGQLDQHLNSSGIILLLVSADFLASDYCYDVEMTRALERHDQREARVIPVLLRKVDGWQGARSARFSPCRPMGNP